MLHSLKTYLMTILVAVLVSIGTAGAVYEPSNQVNVRATADVTYDATSGLYTYSYSFHNAAASVQEVESVAILLGDSSAINVKMPKGWDYSGWEDGVQELPGNKLHFMAVEVDILPPDYVDEPSYWMRGVPSNYTIKPGQTLAGFSFQSPDPPAIVDIYAQGFTKIPDVDDLPDPPPTYFEEAFKGQTKGPNYTETLYTGNRRPATDGFLVFKNLVNRDTKIAPVQVDIEFGLNGETVNQSTFRATLNSEDVTAQFKSTGPKTMRAVFQPTQLNIGGRNTLLTTVQGTLSSNGRTAGDVDRVTFTVQP